MVQDRLFRQRKIRPIAAAILDGYGITEPHEIDIEAIARDRNVLVLVGRLDGADAHLVRKGSRGIIRVSERVREKGRYRFSVAHELGHWELHKATSQFDHCSSFDIESGYRTNGKEMDANIFSTEILLPASMVQSRLGSELSIEVVGSLAGEFETSLTATAIRVVSLSDACCAVVVSAGGRISWYWGSERFENWIEFGEPLSTLTLAYRALNGHEIPTQPSLVPSHAWLSSDYRGPRGIYEDSILMRNYECVLSLISVPED